MTYKLLPCPFCGGTPILELFNDGFFDYARIRCCRVMFDWCGDETGEQAVAAWNRRVDARQLALKTRVCPMCEDCPDGCPVETPEDSRNVVTNDELKTLAQAKAEGRLVGCGIWERMINPFGELEGFMCECGHQSLAATNYCSNCGRKMHGGEAAEKALPTCNVTKLPCAGCNPVCEHREE